MEYDLASDALTTLANDRILARPSYAYAYYGSSDHVVITWEERAPTSSDPNRIHILVR